ncbi:MAG: type II toxin-antitoxin system RelE/ParE family toxin [Verrucomicrobiota bacterium]
MLEIAWTASAERDLLSIYESLFEFFIEDDAMIAKQLSAPLEEELALISTFPGIAPVLKGKVKLRRRVFGPRMRYGLYYVPEGRRILVQAILDLRMYPKEMERRLSEI